MKDDNRPDPRLYPHWSHNRYYGLTSLREAVRAATREHLGGRVRDIAIDLGCGSMPYKPLFSPYVRSYIGADLVENRAADIVVDAATGRVAFDAAAADVLISTQVLEHTASPRVYLQEAWRLAKSDGLLFLSTHGFWMYHADPQDYWRWTGSGLRKCLSDNGWEPQQTIGVFGFAAAAMALLQDALVPNVPRFMRSPFQIFMQQIVGFCDRFYDAAGRQENAALYLIVAKRKPAFDGSQY